MGTFAETVIFDYCLSFADQGEQTSIFRLRFQQTNGSLPFLYIYAAVSIYMYSIFGKRTVFIFMLAFQTENGKQKPGYYP